MRRSSRFRSALAIAAVMTTLASSAEAQRAAGPFAGILGAADDGDATHSLNVRGSLFGSWDDTLSRTDLTGQPVDERFLRSGVAGGASGSLTHARRTQRLQWESSGASALRLYGTKGDDIAATFSGQTALNTTVSRRASVSLSGSFGYSPFYGFAPGLDGRLSNVGAFGGGFGVATAAERNISATAGAGTNIRLSRRDTLDFNGGVQRSEFLDQDSNAIDTWLVGGRWNHTFTRALGLHAGFARQAADYGFAGGDSVTSDSIDIGVDYGDTLEFARRTAFSFTTSTSAVRWNDATHYRLHGSAALTRGFGRSGSASLNYIRSTEFNPGFRDPLLTDTVSAGISDQFGRRASWSAQAGYMRGGIGFGSGVGHFDSYHAGGGVNVALTRRISIFTDYSYYRYDVPAGATVFTSLSKFSRQSVTAGLSLWAPLINERSSSDTR